MHMSKIRVALIYPPFEDRRDRSTYYVAPPIGLLQLAAYLEAAGHEVLVFDFIFELKIGYIQADERLYRTCAERIVASEPDVVGFSTQCSTSPGSINIARHVKKLRSSIKILLGGHDVSFLAEQYLQAFNFIDFVLAWEAELTMPKFVEAVAESGQFEDVAGLAYRAENDQVRFVRRSERIGDLDELLPPSYHLVAPLESYFSLSLEPVVLIESGRGCAFRCEFCQTSHLNGPGVRYRSVPSLVNELKGLCEQYGAIVAYFVHDLFTARREFVEALCTELIAADLPMTWQCRCRLDQVDRELVELMSKAGCRRLLFGVESGSERTLGLMNKKSRSPGADQVVERVLWTVDAGILPSLSMVVGIPEETLDDLNATLCLVAKFMRLGRVNAFIQLVSPLPGTALAKRIAHRMVYIGQSAPTSFSQGIEFLDGCRLPEDEELISSWPEIFQSFQTIVPAHGDIQLCVDVAVAYCRLLEVYAHTYDALVEASRVTHLELFMRFREHTTSVRNEEGLLGLADHQIWDYFRSFSETYISTRSLGSCVTEMFRYEMIVHDLAITEPVVAEGLPGWWKSGKKFQLRTGVGKYDTSGELPWEQLELTGRQPNLRKFLLYMGNDSLKRVELTKVQHDALCLMDSALDIEFGAGRYFDRLADVLKPLAMLGIFEPVAGVAVTCDSSLSRQVVE